MAKKSSKAGAAKAATAANNLALSDGNAAGAALTTPFTEAAQFNGRVHYAGVGAFLVEAGPARLLIMFKPNGNYTPADVGATASHLRFVLGKQEGEPISVAGFPGNAFGNPTIFMISVN